MKGWHDLPTWERALMLAAWAAWARIVYRIAMRKGVWRR
jgi:hypothetical protein